MTGPRVATHRATASPQDHTRSQHRPYVYTGREGRAARPQLTLGDNIRRTEQTVEGDHREHRPCHEVEVVALRREQPQPLRAGKVNIIPPPVDCYSGPHQRIRVKRPVPTTAFRMNSITPWLSHPR